MSALKYRSSDFAHSPDDRIDLEFSDAESDSSHFTLASDSPPDTPREARPAARADHKTLQYNTPKRVAFRTTTPPLCGPRASVRTPPPPPTLGADVLSASDRSVKMRVEQHKKYYDVTGPELANNEATAATGSEAPLETSETPSRRDLVEVIMSTWLGERLSTADKTSLESVLIICAILVVASVAVIIFGVVTIATPNNREQRIAVYEVAAADFEASDTIPESSPLLATYVTGAAAVLRIRGSVSASGISYNPSVAVPFKIQRGPVPLAGPTTSDVTPAISTFLMASDVPISSGAHVVFSMQLALLNSSSAASTIQITVPTVVTLDNQAPPSVLEPSSDPTAPQYLQSVCVLVSIDPTTREVVLDEQVSCYYPFGNWQEYGLTQRSSVPVEIRLPGDPFVVLEGLTAGTLEFSGLARSQQTLDGALSISVACVVLIPTCIVLVPAAITYYRRRVRKMAARKAFQRDFQQAVAPSIRVSQAIVSDLHTLRQRRGIRH